MLFTATSLDISPTSPLPLSGWSHRTSDFKSIKLGLEANILIFDQKETLYIIISVDCLFISSQLKKIIANKLNEYNIKCNDDNILLLASHTHFAPGLDENKPELGKIDKTYIEQTFNKIADTCLNQIKTGFKNGSLQYLKGAYSKLINRRRTICQYRKNLFNWQQKVVIGPNITGPKNDDIHLIKLIDDEANCSCIFWSFASHPVDEPELTSLSSEYIGIVRKHIRKSLKTNIPVIFAQGFAGNIRAKLNPELNSTSSRFRAFLKLPGEFKAEPKNYKQWCSGLLNAIDKTLSSNPINIKDRALSNKINHIPLKGIIHDYKGPIHDLKLQKWKLGGVLIICISAEPVTEYNDILKSIIKVDFIPVGYTADCFGYLPVSKQVKEGGYESEGFFKLFSIEGRFKDKPEEKVIAYLKDQIAQSKS